ncbi:MAG: NYN domain-containing protein [Candidatus Pacebacteria bacterium]|nr:NYN domain-containing protein [Candidatus Paceibacterota bacterium]
MIKIAPNVYERKGDLYAELIIDALKNTNNFDTFILMSGDSDFTALVDELKRQNKWVIVMSTKGHISRKLIERAKYINLKN